MVYKVSDIKNPSIVEVFKYIDKYVTDNNIDTNIVVYIPVDKIKDSFPSEMDGDKFRSTIQIVSDIGKTYIVVSNGDALDDKIYITPTPVTKYNYIITREI